MTEFVEESYEVLYVSVFHKNVMEISVLITKYFLIYDALDIPPN